MKPISPIVLVALVALAVSACEGRDTSSTTPVVTAEERGGGAAEPVDAPTSMVPATAPSPVAAGSSATEASVSTPLAAGMAAPSAMLRADDGTEFDLAAAYAEGPTVLVFYRGGWCPYCTKHLRELGTMEASLRERGFTILAVSPDRPERLQATSEEHSVGLRLLSDQEMELARAFGLAFRVDDETVQRYEGFGIDLRAASGRDHLSLPVPAVYLIDRDGVIRFAHSDPDYRTRLDNEALSAAADRMSIVPDRSERSEASASTWTSGEVGS